MKQELPGLDLQKALRERAEVRPPTGLVWPVNPAYWTRVKMAFQAEAVSHACHRANSVGLPQQAILPLHSERQNRTQQFGESLKLAFRAQAAAAADRMASEIEALRLVRQMPTQPSSITLHTSCSAS